MPLFQNSVINKYLSSQDKTALWESWLRYKKHFLNPAIQQNIRNSKEEQYQGEFLIDLFVNVLGYTKNPAPNFNLTTELKNVKDSKKADGAILIGETAIAVIELKGTNTIDLGKIEPQAFGYKNNQPNCVYVITSNFEKLRFYIDNAIEHIEFNLFKLTDKEFEVLYLCLAYQNIRNGIPKKLKEESLSQEDIITKKLYKDYSQFKRELYQNMTALNPQYPPLELFQKSQKLLDRFLFLFFAEDRLLLAPNSVRTILSQWTKMKEMDAYEPLYVRFKKFFNYLNTGYQSKYFSVFPYNGGLFRADEILDTIQIEDSILYRHTLKISEYDFASEVDVTILGHIFENSLNELDEIKAQLAGTAIDKTQTKRKKDGVFYTPKYITKYIIDSTVGRLCQEKKEALAIADQTTTAENLNAYKTWLLQLTICDPACGSGAFLNEALNFLINEHEYIKALENKLLGGEQHEESTAESELFGAAISPMIENSILENNLFGVDLNEESVEIARLSLWLRTAKPNRKLNDLSNTIKCGNSLIDSAEIAGEKAFDWHKEFPQVFEKKGFDVVIGNPPYFNIQTLGMGSKQAQWIQADYPEIWQDKSDILFYFIAKAMQISKSEIGFIVSNAFLFSDKAQKLRNAIVKDNRLMQVVNFEQFMVFEDASITSCITIFSKNKTETKAVVLKEKNYSITDVSDIINNSENSFAFKLEENKVFALVNDKISALNAKIDQNHTPLQEICIVGKGMETAANAIFTFDDFPAHFPSEFIKKRIVGEYIDRYSLKSIHNFMLYFEDIENFEDLPISIQEYLKKHEDFLANRADKKRRSTAKWWNYSFAMHKEYYHLPKIWCSYRAKNNAFILDETPDYIGLTNTTVIFDTNKDFSLKYILALLNSKLLNFRYKSIGKQTGGGVFEYFANGVGKLPIPFCENQQPFIEKADLMLELHKKLQDISQKFQRNLLREFSLEKLNVKLENWYLLSFADFLKELEKQKAKLKLSQKSEWEEYFAQAKAHATEIATHIGKTDKEIDMMVYALYDLTAEEIEILAPSYEVL